MSLFHIPGIVIRYPDLGLRIFPDQGLLWQINGNALQTFHERASHLRIAEDDQFRISELNADLSGTLGMLDAVGPWARTSTMTRATPLPL